MTDRTTVTDHHAHVRPAHGDDLEAIVSVGRRTWPVANAGLFEPDLMAFFLDKWWTPEACVPAIRAGRAFVAELDGQVVGMASYGPHQGRLVLWKIYTLPECQGRGIGRRLLQEVLDAAPDQYPSLYLSFTDGNASARAFCQANGFIECSREPQGDWPELIWMRHDIGAHEEETRS